MLPISLGFSQERKIQRAKPLMGTLVEIVVYHDPLKFSRGRIEQVIEQAFKEIERIDDLMSVYKADSQISAINNLSGRGFVKVEQDLIRVVEEAIRIGQLSRGAFDITIGPLLQLWGFTDRHGHWPSASQVKEVLSLIDYRNILIDRSNRRIKLRLPGMALDLGGIAKGYAVDWAIRVLREHGIERALVNAGGDLFALGHPAGKDGWHIGIRDPFLPDKIAGILEIVDQAVATSGNYENFLVYKGKKYSHILDPRSGYPVQGIASVTILAKTTMEADALATAVTVLGVEEGMELIDRLPQTEGIIVLDKPAHPAYVLSAGLRGKISLHLGSGP